MARANARVPFVMMGEPVTEKAVGAERATLVTEPIPFTPPVGEVVAIS